jgi:hypothetical protein
VFVWLEREVENGLLVRITELRAVIRIKGKLSELFYRRCSMGG